MKRTAYLSDILFSYLLSALFSLCFFRYLRLSLLLSLLLALVVGALVALCVRALLLTKRRTLFLKKTEEEEKRKLLFHLALLSDREKTEFFKTVLEGDSYVGRLRLALPTEFYFLHFKLSPVTADDVASYARLKTNKRKILLCSALSSEAADLCARFQIEVLDGEGVYRLVRERNALPAVYLGEENEEKKRKPLRLWFSKGNAKRFLLSGGLVLLSSFLTPFPFYYLLFGSLLLVAALFVRLFGYS